jgi:hypothetical protein
MLDRGEIDPVSRIKYPETSVSIQRRFIMKKRLHTIFNFGFQVFTILCVLTLLAGVVVKCALLGHYNAVALLEAYGPLFDALSNIPIIL